MEKKEPNNRAYKLWWIAAVFILLAITFLIDLWGDKRTIKDNPLVDYKYLSKKTVRDPLYAPVTQVAGFTYNCNNCHQNITPSKESRPLIAAHQNINMDHGNNKHCYNCHDRQDRERLVDMAGDKVRFDQSELVCQKCHGPKYRDWLAGVHGRPNGYWDLSKGKSVKARCVSCHDPHAPKFKPLKPLPPPVRNNYMTDEDISHE